MRDILIFVEDPGAANMLVGMRPYFDRLGMGVVVTAAGSAREILEVREEQYLPVDAATSAADVIDDYRPQVVAVGTAENRQTLGLALAAEARRRGIPTVGLVDSFANSQWRWRGETHDPLAYMPDWLAVPDDITRTEYMTLGVSAERVIAVGYVQADYVAEHKTKFDARGKGAMRDAVLPRSAWRRQVLVFAAEQFGGIGTDRYRRADDYTIHGRGGSNERIHIVLEEVLDALVRIQPRPYVVVRLHPKNSRADFEAYQNEIDFISRSEDPLELIYSSDVVVGATSTLLLEAHLMERPTLAVVPRVPETWIERVGEGIIPTACTRDQVEDYLARMLNGEYTISPAGSLMTGVRGRLANLFYNVLCYGSVRAPK